MNRNNDSLNFDHKEVKKAAYHDRWDRIIQKGCRYFGVEKPKQQKKRK